MSALLNGISWRRPSEPEEQEGPSRHLWSVPTPQHRMARVPFLLVLAATLGLGMIGLLVLNTTVQTKAVEVRALEQQLTTLSYTEAELKTQLDQAESPADLAEKASDLGMRPNPYPAFIDVETGEVSGDPRVVTGDELTSLVTESEEKKAADAKAEQQQAEREAAEEAAAEKEAAEEQAAEKQAAEERATAEEESQDD